MGTFNGPAVVIDETGFTVQIRIEDPTALDYVKGTPEERRVEILSTAALIGIRALATSTTNGAIITMTDQVQAAAKAASEHVTTATQTMQRTLQMLVERYCAEDGILATNLEKIGAEVLDPDKAETLIRFRERVAKDVKLILEPLARQLTEAVNVNDESKPFGQMSREIKGVRENLVAIKTHLDNQTALVAAARGNPTYTGRSLEDFYASVIGELAAHQGETLEDVRNVTGLVERSKAGDFLTTIDGRLTPAATVKVVAETKNRRNTTLTALLAELDRAMSNRRADVGLGILVHPNAPAIFYQNRHVVVNLPAFGSPSADYAVYSELLRIGYDMARFIGIQSARLAHHEPSIDLQGIKNDVDDLSKATQKFSTLKDNHTRIETAVNNARSTADEMKSDFVAIGTRLRKRITDALKRVTEGGSSSEAA